MGKVTVEQWKELFRDAGLSRADMDAWHQAFERRYPEGHQDFLEWLGLDPDAIMKIRAK